MPSIHELLKYLRKYALDQRLSARKVDLLKVFCMPEDFFKNNLLVLCPVRILGQTAQYLTRLFLVRPPSGDDRQVIDFNVLRRIRKKMQRQLNTCSRTPDRV